MKKGILILTLLILALFSVSGIYAADVNDTLAASEDTGDIELSHEIESADDNLGTSEEQKVTQTDSEGKIGATDDGTFKALNATINGASSGDTIYLENDYSCEDSWTKNNGIDIIASNLVIDGNGKLDNNVTGLDENVIFTPTSPGTGSVTATIGDVAYTAKLTVIDVPYELLVSATDIVYNETDAVISVTIPDGGRKDNLTIAVNNVVYPSDSYIQKDNIVTLDIAGLDAGDYNVKVQYKDDVYAYKENTTSFTVNKAASSIEIEVDSVYFVDDEVVITLIPSFSGSAITVTINGGDYTVADNTATLTAVYGEYIVVATLAGDKNHNASESSVIFSVEKIQAFITVDYEYEYMAGTNVSVIVYGPDDRIGEVLITGDLNDYTDEFEGEYTSVFGDDLAITTYTIKVTYSENDKYLKDSVTVTFMVIDRYDTDLFIDSIVTDKNTNKTTIDITITDFSGSPFDISGNVTVVVKSGDEVVKEITSGELDSCKVTLDLGEIAPGTYDFVATYNSNTEYKNSSATKEYEVPLVSNYELSVIATDIVYNESYVGIFVTVPDGAKKEYLKITVNNVVYSTEKYVEFENLIAMNLAELDAGTYNVKVQYKDDVYAYKENTTSFTVAKADSILTVDDVVLDYGTSANVTVTAEGATGIAASIITQKGNVIEVEVMGFTVMIPVLDAGNYTLNVTTKADANHNPVTKTANITVNKASTEITIASPTGEMSAGAMAHVAAELNPSKAGNLTYTSNDTSVVNVSSTGVIKANGAGTALITVSFAGSDNYAAAENKTIAITVKLNDASISVNNSTLELFIGDNFTVVAVSDPAGLNVTFVQDDSGVYIVDENGTVTALREGTGNVLVKVGDGKVYAVNSTEIAVSVSKVPTEININATSLDLFVGDEIVIAANLTPADAGNVTFTSSDYDVVDFDDEGNVIAQGKGQAIITVSFAGDNKYAAAENKTITVTVSLNDASVTVDNDTLDLNVGETYAINATKSPDTILLDIAYTSSDSSVVRVDENGVVTAVGEGSAIITVEVGDGEIYAVNSTNVTVTVSRIPTEIVADPITAIYNANEYLVITLKDANGTPLSGENITVDVNGIETYLTDENGSVNVSTKGLASGIYDARITFNGTDAYDKSAKAVNVTIKKATPVINATAKTFKTTDKTKKYTITLKDNTGKAIKKVTVYLKVGGKTYKATTNSQGKATFKITKLNNKGTYKATVTYKGNKYYNKATKKVTIKVKEVWKTVSKGSKDSAIVKKIQRALKNHGYYLEYNGRYLMVDGIFWDYTEMAVKEFQKDKTLKVTGKVDEKTAKKLGII